MGVVKMGGVAQILVRPDGSATTKCGDCGLIMDVPQRLFPEERAVIEAAEVWLHEQIHDPNSTRNVKCQYSRAELSLTLAIEDLQATRAPVPLDKVKTWEGE